MMNWRGLFKRSARGRGARRLDPEAVAALPLVHSLIDAQRLPTSPVVIESATLLRKRRRFFVRMRSTDGVEGVAVGHERLEFVWPVLAELVLPCFVGQDARQIERLVNAVARHDGNYKVAGLAFWTCLAAAEMAALDLLGKASGRSVAELLGAVSGRDVPVYLSSLRRETTPEREIELVAERLAATGAKEVKLKIGGRMGVFDAAPGRTEALVSLARRTLGDAVAVKVDANGSYNAAQAVEIGRMLEAQGVTYFEEPCPWEDFAATKQVADLLEAVQVAGGEQDGSIEKLRWQIDEHGLDIVTPDAIASGGLIRALRVVRMAEAAGVPIAFHSPRSDYLACAMLHLASALPRPDGPHEFPADEPRRDAWWAPQFAVRDGVVAAPTGPGLGMTIDPAELRRARVV